jgi:glutamate/aspartate transport system substrate-binding protein
VKIEQNGEGEKLYKTWFMSPIPPKNINLDMPMSDTMKAVFEHPNDRPMDD